MVSDVVNLHLYIPVPARVDPDSIPLISIQPSDVMYELTLEGAGMTRGGAHKRDSWSGGGRYDDAVPAPSSSDFCSSVLSSLPSSSSPIRLVASPFVPSSSVPSSSLSVPCPSVPSSVRLRRPSSVRPPVRPVVRPLSVRSSRRPSVVVVRPVVRPSRRLSVVVCRAA